MKVEAFIDANWVGIIDDQRLTSSYSTLVGDNLVTWQSKKQAIGAKSSVDVEYRARPTMWLSYCG